MREHLLDALTVVRVEELERAPPEVLPIVPTKDRVRGGADVGDETVGVEDRDHVARVLHERAEPGFGACEGLFRSLPIECHGEDVAEHQEGRERRRAVVGFTGTPGERHAAGDARFGRDGKTREGSDPNVFEESAFRCRLARKVAE